MNFEKVLRKNRKAISPVLATVILIAITLIAAVAIAGFVFGLFGTFTKTASVSLGAASCTDAAPTVCTMSWTNTGNAATSIPGTCQVTEGGATYTGTAAFIAPLPAGGVFVSGGAGSLTCTGTNTVVLGAGAAVSGSVSLGNGGSALFSGSG